MTLDLFQVLMATRLLGTAKRKTEEERLSTLRQLEKASRVLARAPKLWASVEEAPRAAVLTAAATVVSLVPEEDGSAEVALRAALANRYAAVRPFLSLLSESNALDAASAGKRVLAAVRGLPAPARRKAGVKPLLPREEDIARLSPLKHRNLNLLGRYSFTASTRPPAPCARCATRTRWSWTRTMTAVARSERQGPNEVSFSLRRHRGREGCGVRGWPAGVRG